MTHSPPGPSDPTQPLAREVNIYGTDRVSVFFGGSDSDVHLFDSTVYGALAGNTVNLEYSVLNYDTRGRNVQLNGRGQVSVISSVNLPPSQASAALDNDVTENPIPPLGPPPDAPVTIDPLAGGGGGTTGGGGPGAGGGSGAPPPPEPPGGTPPPNAPPDPPPAPGPPPPPSPSGS